MDDLIVFEFNKNSNNGAYGRLTEKPLKFTRFWYASSLIMHLIYEGYVEVFRESFDEWYQQKQYQYNRETKIHEEIGFVDRKRELIKSYWLKTE